jgi:TPR repeat protein
MSITPEYNPDIVMAAFERRDYAFVLENAMPFAVAGNPDAQCMASLLYQCGLGVKRDIDEAERWLLKATAQDSALAWNNLGTLYATYDSGSSHSRKRIKECYLRAKKLGFNCADPYPPPFCE